MPKKQMRKFPDVLRLIEATAAVLTIIYVSSQIFFSASQSAQQNILTNIAFLILVIVYIEWRLSTKR